MLDVIEKGGWVILTIMACSLVACAVLIERWLYFRSADSKSAQIRKLLADPHLPNKLAAGSPDQVRPCIYCYTCISNIFKSSHVICAVNPLTGFETERQPRQPQQPPDRRHSQAGDVGADGQRAQRLRQAVAG